MSEIRSDVRVGGAGPAKLSEPAKVQAPKAERGQTPAAAGRALRSDAAKAASLPPAGQRAALRARLSEDRAQLEILRPTVGDQAYVIARAANCLERLRQGASSLRDGLDEFKELRALLPTADDHSKPGLETLDAIEREAIKEPLRELSSLSLQSGRPEKAAHFQEKLKDLDRAMDQLRLSPDPAATESAKRILTEIHANALSDDKLFAGLPSGEANRLRSELSAGLQSLLRGVADRTELNSPKAQKVAGQIALSNTLSRATERALGDGFDQTAFKNLLRPALIAAEAGPELAPGGFKKELAALNADPLTQRKALNLLHDLATRLNAKGALDPAQKALAGRFRDLAAESADSQFGRGKLTAADFALSPPRVDSFIFPDRLVEIGHRLAQNPDDPEAREDLRLLGQDMALAGLEPISLDEDGIKLMASLRSAIAKADSLNTDEFANLAQVAKERLAALSDGPDKTLLTSELSDFENFRSGFERTVTVELTNRLDDIEDLLSGSPTPGKIEETLEGLEGTFARAAGDSRLGPALKETLSTRVEAAKNSLSLKLLDAQLAQLKTPRAAVPNLTEIAKARGPIPGAAETIEKFSRERLKEITKQIEAIKVGPKPGPYAGTGAKAAFARLSSQIERLTLPKDQTAAKAALASQSEKVAKDLGEAAFGRIDPKAVSALTEAEKTSLKTVLAKTMGNEAIVRMTSRAEPPGSTAKSLASLVNLKPNEIAAKVDELFLDRPDLDQAALDLKLALTPEESHEEISAAHNDLRLKRQTADLLKEGGGQDLLDSLGVERPEDLKFAQLKDLLANSLTDGDKAAPSYKATTFNSLLVKTAWSSFLRENGLKGSEADILAFRSQAPPPLSTADPAVLKGLFDLGPISGSMTARAIGAVKEGARLMEAGDIGQLMDRMSDHNPALKAQRALTSSLRNMLSSSGIEYDPAADNARAYATALKTGLEKRANQPSLSEKAADAVKRGLGFKPATSAGDYSAQVKEAMARTKALSGSLAKIQRLEADVAEALRFQDEAFKKLRPPDLNSLKFTPGAALSSDPEIRLVELSDPWRVLRHQNALDPATGAVDGSKIRGETEAMGVIALRDILKDDVTGLDSSKKKLAALKSFPFPDELNFKRARGASFAHPAEPEAKAFGDNVRALKALDPNHKDFEKDFKRLSDLVLKDVEKYKLDQKAELILAFKNSDRQSRHRESGGATIGTTISDATKYGESPQGAALAYAKDKAIGTSLSVKTADAMLVGLKKIHLHKAAPGTPGGLLKAHFLTEGKTLALRGQGANIEEAARRAQFEARRNLDGKRAALDEALADFSTHAGELLKDATRQSALAAFVSLGYKDFGEAEKALGPESGNSRLKLAIRDNLRENFGIEGDLAENLIEKHLVLPIATAAVKAGGLDPGGVFESFCDEAKPSEEVLKIRQKIDKELAAPVKALVQSEANRKRFDALLDQLDPGSAIDFTAENKTSVRVGTGPGLVSAHVGVSLALEKGVSLSRDADGVYQLAIRGGGSAGLGVGISVLEGAVEASVGLAAKSSECLTFEFKSKDDAAAFLQKMSDKAFSPEDLYRHCQNVKVVDSKGVGVALAAQVELGEIPILESSPIGGKALFTAGMSLSGGYVRNSEVDASSQTLTVTSTVRGQISLNLSVGKAEEKDAEQENEVDLDEDMGVTESLEAAAREGLTVDDKTRGVFFKGLSFGASVGVEDGKLSCDFSIEAIRSSSVSRSTAPGSRGRFEGATQNVDVKFEGERSLTQFKKYAEKNLGLSESATGEAIKEIQERGEPFVLEATFQLKPEAAERCRQMEIAGEPASAIREVLGDDANYEIGVAKLTFTDRTETEEGQEKKLNLAFAKFSYQRTATATGTYSVEYRADNGILRPIDQPSELTQSGAA